MERQRVFQQLKLPCIQLLQLASKLKQTPAARRELLSALTNLLTTIQSITARSGLLDAKLAEYIFVPISQVLRLSRQVPVRALELCLECISLLLTQGWRGSLEPALSTQLLILFTFLAKPTSAENGISATSEELQSIAFTCIAHLLDTASRTSQGKESIVAAENIPLLAEAVLTMLDGVAESKSTSVRLQAATALSLLIDTIPDDDALASFLPKMVSSLTKVLTLSSSNRPNFRILEQSLHVLSAVLLRLLGDQKTRDLPESALPGDRNTVLRSQSWVRATAAQIKIAFAHILRLRDHDKSEVREALLKLCLCVTSECRISLSPCACMAIEAIMSLIGQDDSESEDRVKAMLSADQELANILRESLYSWITSLPRIMQSTDSHGKYRVMLQVSVALRLTGCGLATRDEKLANSLQDGISRVLADSRGLEVMGEKKIGTASSQSLAMSSTSSKTFQPLSFRLKGQDAAMAEFQMLMQEIARSEAGLCVAQELSSLVDASSSEGRLASFWGSVQIIKSVSVIDTPLDEVMDMGVSNSREVLLDDLYCHALAALNQKVLDAEISWQHLAVALEVVALQATRLGSDFRGELSDVLYPVLQCLGSRSIALQEHTLVCLTIMSEALQYANTEELLVANVDYVINAVGLKFAYGDISPQGPRILLMMLRLCGYALLPYLDDLVGSIFDALERYHGYPQLAELLFSVLKGILEEGMKAPELMPGSDAQDNRHAVYKEPLAMTDVVARIQQVASWKEQKREQGGEALGSNDVPQQPWGEVETRTEDLTSSYDGEPQVGNDGETETAPRTRRVLTLFLRISELTQHYLTTGSPRFRSSLLSLLDTIIPTLAQHESDFLPLIHTLWPVLLPRLQDTEAYVVSIALRTVASLCKHAGSFMRSRIEGAWDSIRDVYTRVHGQPCPVHLPTVSIQALVAADPSAHDPSSDSGWWYVDTPSRMMWQSMVVLLCAIGQHVVSLHQGRPLLDDILDMLHPVLDHADVYAALEHGNADALWLRLYQKKKRSDSQKSRSKSGSESRTSTTNEPILSSSSPAQPFSMETVKIPIGRASWNFVRI